MKSNSYGMRLYIVSLVNNIYLNLGLITLTNHSVVRTFTVKARLVFLACVGDAVSYYLAIPMMAFTGHTSATLHLITQSCSRNIKAFILMSNKVCHKSALLFDNGVRNVKYHIASNNSMRRRWTTVVSLHRLADYTL